MALWRVKILFTSPLALLWIDFPDALDCSVLFGMRHGLSCCRTDVCFAFVVYVQGHEQTPTTVSVSLVCQMPSGCRVKAK